MVEHDKILRLKLTVTASPRSGNDAPFRLNASTRSVPWSRRTRSRTIAPRKVASSTAPVRALSPSAGGPRRSASGRSASALVSPALAPSMAPRARSSACPTRIAPSAGSTTTPSSVLSVPTNDATKRVRGRL